MESGQMVRVQEHSARPEIGLGFSTVEPRDPGQDILSHWGSVFSSVLEDISVWPNSQSSWARKRYHGCKRTLT